LNASAILPEYVLDQCGRQLRPHRVAAAGQSIQRRRFDSRPGNTRRCVVEQR
jgi:hypothetical protein